jgi:hypothetical protein
VAWYFFIWTPRALKKISELHADDTVEPITAYEIDIDS